MFFLTHRIGFFVGRPSGNTKRYYAGTLSHHSFRGILNYKNRVKNLNSNRWLSKDAPARRVGEFLAGTDYTPGVRLARKAGFLFLGVTLAATGTLAAFNLDQILEVFGITKPSLALKANAFRRICSSEQAVQVLGTPIICKTSSTVMRQMMIKRKGEYMQRIKFEVMGPNTHVNVFAEGDVQGEVSFLALEECATGKTTDSQSETSGAQQCNQISQDHAPLILLGSLDDRTDV